MSKEKECWFHSYTRLPVLTEHYFNPITNESYILKSYECIKCGKIKIEKEKE